MLMKLTKGETRSIAKSQRTNGNCLFRPQRGSEKGGLEKDERKFARSLESL